MSRGELRLFLTTKVMSLPSTFCNNIRHSAPKVKLYIKNSSQVKVQVLSGYSLRFHYSLHVGILLTSKIIYSASPRSTAADAEPGESSQKQTFPKPLNITSPPRKYLQRIFLITSILATLWPNSFLHSSIANKCTAIVS